MNILITGATGFIGRHLVSRLSANQDKIFCLVRKTSKIDPIKKDGVEFIYSDITNYDDLKIKISKAIDIIVHCAGLVESKDIEKLNKVNVLGTKNICRLALELNIKKFIHISSVAVVSGNLQDILTEELPFKASNKYGESKIGAEKTVIAYKNRGLKVVIVRPSMVYGEDEPHLLGLLLFLLKYRLLPLFAGGEARLHLVYIENVIDSIVFAITDIKCCGETFFIADNETLSVKDVFTIMATSIGSKPPYLLPQWTTTVLLRLPVVGRRVKSLIKDRVYAQEKIISLGFKHKYETRLSLIKSAQAICNLSKTHQG